MSGRRRTAACALMAAVLVVGQMPQARSATVTTLATRLDAIRRSRLCWKAAFDALKNTIRGQTANQEYQKAHCAAG